MSVRMARILAEQRLGDYNPKVVSADYSMNAGDTVVTGNLASSSFTVTLPSVAEAPGVTYTFRVHGSVAPNFMAVVDGGDSGNNVGETLQNDDEVVMIMSNGTLWSVVKGVD